MVAGYTMGLEPSGRELLVVVVKGTFGIPAPGEPVQLTEAQEPLVMADVFFGEPGKSAPRYEAEFAPRKPRCDVLLHATAHAPGGRPAARVQVGASVGGWSKTFVVVGDRVWEAGVTGVGASSPMPFVKMPITYDRAFGGIDDRGEDTSRHAAFMPNPSGRGFHKQLRNEWVDGSPLPNTEEIRNPVRAVNGEYRPMSFGPIGRHWEPRARYAGTYDDKWLEDHFPFLPPDFDEQYYQSAPVDQQVPHLRGGETIALANLTPAGQTSFTLPVFDAPIHFFPRKGDREDGQLVLDTITIEPDLDRFTLVWRATRPIKRKMLELAQVMVGKRSQEWWAEREKIEFPIQLIPAPRMKLAPSAESEEA